MQSREDLIGALEQAAGAAISVPAELDVSAIFLDFLPCSGVDYEYATPDERDGDEVFDAEPVAQHIIARHAWGLENLYGITLSA